MSNLSFDPTSPTGKALLAWYRKLHGLGEPGAPKPPRQSGDRARLRRADGPEAVALVPAYHGLLAALAAAGAPATKRDRWATIAGLLSRVKDHQPGQPFAAAMGRAREGSSRPAVSEPRVRHLLEAKTPEEGYTPLRRALEQLDAPVDVLRLAQDLFWWGAEKRRDWAYTYYAELSKSSKGDAK